MPILSYIPKIVDENRPFSILSPLDLIDHMAAYHTEQAVDLAQLARWHRQQAQSLLAERRTLAADVDAALTEVDRLLQ